MGITEERLVEMEKEKINLEKARELAEKYGEIIASKQEEIEKEEFKKFFLLHCESVGEAAVALSKGKADEEILRIAGWVHDIGKAISYKEHAKHSLKILEKNFEINEKLKDCILNHSSDKNPKTKEGKIFRVADKAFILNPKYLKFLVENTEELRKEEVKFIKLMVEKAIDLLKNYKWDS